MTPKRLSTQVQNPSVQLTAPLPSQQSIAKICELLVKQHEKEIRDTKYAPVKTVLALLGHGAVLGAAFLAPKSAPALLSLIQDSPDWDAWKHFNASYLKRTLARLEKQKHVEIIRENGQDIIRLTKNGQRKILRCSLDHLAVEKPKHWDGKWRLVLYDVPETKSPTRDIIRQALRSIGFYAIQESVYVFPYPCFDHIQFLREYYGAGAQVQYMLVNHIEDDAVYKIYFNLS